MKAIGFMMLAAALCLFSHEARAIPPFRDAFNSKYVGPSNDDEFKKAAKAANCSICHVPHKDKKIRNDYGKALAKITGGDVSKRLAAARARGGEEGEHAETEKILKTLEKAFEKVADETSSTGKTYGERIKAGKLPNP